MNELQDPPLDTPFSQQVNANRPWSDFFIGVKRITSRPQVTATLDFPNTAAQASSDLAVAFPDDTVAVGDFPLVSPPSGSMFANSCYTAHVVNPDEVVVRFNNYSAAAKNPASGDFMVTVIKQ